MRCRLFAILAGLSLLLGVLTCVAWGLSYGWYARCGGRWNRVERGDAERMRTAHFILVSEWGQLEVTAISDPSFPFNAGNRAFYLEMVNETPWYGEWSGTIDVVRRVRDHLGLMAFDWKTIRRGSGSEIRVWKTNFPHWSLALLFAVLPAVHLVGRARRRRRAMGNRCEGCGYDLRASTERCPECGRAIAPKPAGTASPTA